MKNEVIVVVDAYLSGKAIAEVARDLGLNCIHVKSCQHLPQHFLKKYESALFVEDFDFQEDPNHVIQLLKDRNVVAVFPGVETGVGLSEVLLRELGLPGNDPRSVGKRTQKRQFVESLREKGFATPKQWVFTDLSQISLSEIEWPVVLKPNTGAGGDGVFFCDSQSDLERAVGHNLTKRNILGHKNTQFVLQEKIVGTEFAVNSVSWEGKVYVTDIWQYHKTPVEGFGNIFDFSILIHPTVKEFAILADFVSKALPSLGCNFGPTHAEVILTPSGPMLLNLGSRFQGGISQRIWHQFMPYHQILVAIDVQQNRKPPSEAKRELLKYQVVWCDVKIDQRSRVIRSDEFFRKLRGITSIKEHNLKFKSGGVLPKTIDLPSSPGDLFFVGNDFESLKKDKTKFYRYLQEHLVEVEVPG
jgi:L-amino acid ligase